MSKRKKLDILKRLPNGSVLSVTGSAVRFYEVTVNGDVLWYGMVSTAKEDLASLEIIIRSLGAAYQALELDYEDAESKSEQGA